MLSLSLSLSLYIYIYIYENRSNYIVSHHIVTDLLRSDAMRVFGQVVMRKALLNIAKNHIKLHRVTPLLV